MTEAGGKGSPVDLNRRALTLGEPVMRGEPSSEPKLFPVRTEKHSLMTTPTITGAIRRGIPISWPDIPVDVVRDIVELTAVETQQPASLLGRAELHNTRLQFLGDHSLSGLYNFVYNSPERQGKSTPAFLLEQVGVEFQPPDIIRAIQLGKYILWSQLPPGTIQYTLDYAAQEIDLAPALWEKVHFSKELDCLEGKTLENLYRFGQRANDRGEKDPVEYLLEKTDFTLETDDVIHVVRAGKLVPWRRVDGEILHEMLSLMAAELHIPVSMLGVNDIEKQRYDFLDGFSLPSLLSHFVQMEEEKGKKGIELLHEKAKSPPIIEADVIATIRADRSVFWDRILGEVHGELIHRVAEEIGMPASMMQRPDFAIKCDFLNGHSISGLYANATWSPERGEKGVLDFIHDKAGITINTDDVITAIKIGRAISWARIPIEVKGELIKKAAEEIGVPVTRLQADEVYRRKFDFLGGHTLSGIYIESRKKRADTTKSVYETFLEEAGIKVTADEVIDAMRMGRRVFWQQIPEDALRRILEQAAEELGKPVTMLAAPDLRNSFAFLGGTSLGGLYEFTVFRDDERQGLDVMSRIREKIDVEITTDDLVKAISQGQTIIWRFIPETAMKGLMERVAKENAIPVSMITSGGFLISYDFLGGRSLAGLYSYYCREKDDPFETGSAYMKKTLGYPDTAGGRKGFRRAQMSRFLLQYTQGKDTNNLTVEDLIPWAVDVSDIYRNKFLGIEKEEIQNELFIFLSDYFGSVEGIGLEDLVRQAHLHIERQISTLMSQRYKEKSLATKIGDTELTLADTLEDQTDLSLPKERMVFSRKTNKALSQLSSLQKALVIGITIKEYTFDDMVGQVRQEFEIDTDVDTLQEHFEEALIIIRGQLEADRNMTNS